VELIVMCKASIVAKKQESAKRGQNLTVSVSTHGLAAFHPEGKKVADCVTCVKDGTTLTLNGISPELQREHGLGQYAVVTFVDKGHNLQDMIRLSDGREIDLMAFANKRVRAYVGVLESPMAPEDFDPVEAAQLRHQRRVTVAVCALLFAVAAVLAPFANITLG
jgi:hypothetical protein